MTKIEWTQRPGTKGETWNVTVGCSLESAGCEHCYAMTFVHRKLTPEHEGLTEKKNAGVKWNGKIKLLHDRLHLPLNWKTPRTAFVNSISDLFHKDIPFEFIDSVYDTMDACPQHTFIVLTKRAKRMLEFYQWKAQGNGLKFEEQWPLKNVEIGVSCEDQKTFDERTIFLIQCAAFVRLVSLEPLLGTINAESRLKPTFCQYVGEKSGYTLPAINWVIAGGESGPKARPMHPDWARSLRDQCAAAGVPFFFKQWGEYRPYEQTSPPFYRDAATGQEYDGHGMNHIDYDHPSEAGTFNGCRWYPPMDAIGWCMETKSEQCTWLRMGKSAAGNLLDGKQHLEFPDPKTPAHGNAYAGDNGPTMGAAY
jgi:protein gp37